MQTKEEQIKDIIKSVLKSGGVYMSLSHPSHFEKDIQDLVDTIYELAFLSFPAGYTKSSEQTEIIEQLKNLEKEFESDEVFGFTIRGKLKQWESLTKSPEIKPTPISDEEIQKVKE